MGEWANRGKSLVSVTIYVEGGGNAESTLRICRQGFARYCAKLVQAPRRLAIVACGGREQTFDKFKRAVSQAQPDDICAMLVDSEAPVTMGSTVEHLRSRDGWKFPTNLNGHRVFLMAQAMEAWFLADREAMAVYYNGGFRPNHLPGRPDDIETIRKSDLEPSLVRATRDTQTKGIYHKVRHGFALLEMIDPNKVEAGSPQAKLLNDFLRSL